MGVIDGFLNMMNLGADDDDEEEYNRGYEDGGHNVSRKPAAQKEAAGSTESSSENVTNIRRVKDTQSSKPSPVRTPVARRKDQSAANMQVCVIKPTSFDDSREITETLLEGRPVFLNMEGLDIDVAQRIIDFASGSCYALSGNLQKVSNYIFLLTPSNVEISGDFAELLDTYKVGGLKTNF